MKLKLHYVEFRKSDSKTGGHLRKGKYTLQMNRPLEAQTVDSIGDAAQTAWNKILAEGKEVEFRRLEVCNWDWKPASS